MTVKSSARLVLDLCDLGTELSKLLLCTGTRFKLKLQHLAVHNPWLFLTQVNSFLISRPSTALFAVPSNRHPYLVGWACAGDQLCLVVTVPWGGCTQVWPKAGAAPGEPACVWHFSTGSRRLDVTSRSKPEGAADLPTSRYLSKAWCRCFEPRVQQSVTAERLWKCQHWWSQRECE